MIEGRDGKAGHGPWSPVTWVDGILPVGFHAALGGRYIAGRRSRQVSFPFADVGVPAHMVKLPKCEFDDIERHARAVKELSDTLEVDLAEVFTHAVATCQRAQDAASASSMDCPDSDFGDAEGGARCPGTGTLPSYTFMSVGGLGEEGNGQLLWGGAMGNYWQTTAA